LDDLGVCLNTVLKKCTSGGYEDVIWIELLCGWPYGWLLQLLDQLCNILCSRKTLCFEL